MGRCLSSHIGKFVKVCVCVCVCIGKNSQIVRRKWLFCKRTGLCFPTFYVLQQDDDGIHRAIRCPITYRRKGFVSVQILLDRFVCVRMSCGSCKNLKTTVVCNVHSRHEMKEMLLGFDWLTLVYETIHLFSFKCMCVCMYVFICICELLEMAKKNSDTHLQ